MGDVQLDSHAKAQSLVGGGLDVPTVHDLTVDGLLDALEIQEVGRMAGHVGTWVVVVGAVERCLVKSAMIQEGAQLAGDASGRVVLRPS